jgi:hypothetical protein
MSSNIEKELDFADYDKDEPEEGKAVAKAAVNNAAAKVAKKAAAQEKRYKAALAEKAEKEAAQKEIDAILAVMSPDHKGRMLAAMSVAASPITKAKYDHEPTMKRLIAVQSVRAIMEKHMSDYETVHYMMSLCVYWKTLIPLNPAQNREHVAFMKHFNKERHLYGLPEKTVADALGDLMINEDEGADVE